MLAPISCIEDRRCQQSESTQDYDSVWYTAESPTGFAKCIQTPRAGTWINYWGRCSEIKRSDSSITVATRSDAWTVFAHLNTVFAGSDPTRGTDVCLRLFCVCALLCVGSGLATGWSPVQGVLPTMHGITKLKKRAGPWKELRSHCWKNETSPFEPLI
jgi:hypothetical protein